MCHFFCYTYSQRWQNHWELPMDLRVASALEIAARCRLIFDKGVWLVPSQSGSAVLPQLRGATECSVRSRPGGFRVCSSKHPQEPQGINSVGASSPGMTSRPTPDHVPCNAAGPTSA